MACTSATVTSPAGPRANTSEGAAAACACAEPDQPKALTTTTAQESKCRLCI